jgi:hypothetical protein
MMVVILSFKAKQKIPGFNIVKYPTRVIFKILNKKSQEPNHKNQITRTKSQEPNCKNQIARTKLQKPNCKNQIAISKYQEL